MMMMMMMMKYNLEITAGRLRRADIPGMFRSQIL
jgi:hypothetical protein